MERFITLLSFLTRIPVRTSGKLDEEFHKRLYKKYGEPILIKSTSIQIRMHESNAQYSLSHKNEHDLKIINKKND